MAGYTRQSAADIVPTAVVRAAPINNELNALRDAFNATTGHTHDGTSAEGAPIPLISDTDGNNKVAVDQGNNRVGVFVEVSTNPVEQVRFQDGAIVPVTDDDIDLGASGAEFKNLYIDGTASIDSLVADTADINGGTLDGVVIGGATPAAATFTTATVNSSATIASADINAGTIDGTVIGASSAQAVTGTVITASSGFVGPLTGAVTGNVTGNLTGNVAGNVTGNLTGNVTASTGTSTFNNVTIAGTLDMDGASAATIINLSTPSNAGDAATKGYVDTADALKLNLSGGTMSGNIAMGTNKVTGLGTPTDSADAATKGYVDTSVANLVDSAPVALDTLNELAAALGDDANFSTTVTNSIATKLPLAGGTMSGAIAMGTNKITGLGDPTSAQDAATKTYVDTADALKLSLTGGTMSGAIAMGTSKITGLGDPTNTQDAATKNYVDTQDALKLSLTGGTMTGAIDMGSNNITTTHTPSGNSDVTNKLYIDTLFGSTVSAATSAAAAAVSAAAALASEGNAEASELAAAASEAAALSHAGNAEASYDAFDDRYLGAKTSDPSVDNDGDPLLTGALYFNSSAGLMKVYDGTLWVNAGSSVNGTSERQVYTATSGQTVFNATYDAGYVDVYLNGVKLVVGTDFTATNGTSISLTVGATSGDIVDIVAYAAFDLANVYTQAQSDARYIQTETDPIVGAITGIVKADGAGNIEAAVAGTDYLAPAAIGVTVQAYDATYVVDADIGVSVQAYDADTAKTDVAQSFTAQQTFAELKETVYTLGTSGSIALDPANGSIQVCVATGAPTFTDSLEAGQTVVLHLENGDTYAPTWPTVTWTTSAGDVAPTVTNKDVFVFWKISTTLYAAYVGSYA